MLTTWTQVWKHQNRPWEKVCNVFHLYVIQTSRRTRRQMSGTLSTRIGALELIKGKEQYALFKVEDSLIF